MLMIYFRQSVMLATILLCLAGAESALAQQVPATADPARTPAGPIEEPEEEDGFELDFSVEIEGGVSVPPGMEEEELDFEGMRIEGASIYPAEELEAIWRDKVGESITYLDFFGFVSAVSEKYQKDGYVLSFAFYPAQEVDDGVFTMQVVEGYISDARVKGDPSAKDAIHRLIGSLVGVKPLNAAMLERKLLLVNDIAGVRGSSVLRPANDVQGASVLEIDVEEDPWSARLELNNRGTEFAGPNQVQGGLVLNSLFGYGEKLSFSATVATRPNEMKQLALTAELPVEDDGWVIGTSMSASRSEPGSTLQALRITSYSKNFSMFARRPLIRSRQENLNITGKLEINHSKSTNNPNNVTGILTRDNLRVASVGVDYFSTNLMPGGVTSLTGEFRQGLPFFGPSTADSNVPVSRADADNGFTVVKGSFVHVRPIASQMSMLLTANAQYARKPLFSGEEFGVGGQGIGRAFDSSEITGDTGISSLIEVRYNVLPETLEKDISFLDSMQLYSFFDWGRAWNLHVSDVTKDRMIASTGAGMRTTLGDGLSFDFELAKPVMRGLTAEGGSKDIRGFSFLRVAF